MASKANPSYLLLAWKLQGAFEVFVANPTGQGRVAQKRLGVVTKFSHSEKAKVENKVDQAVFLLQTNAQEEGAAPFSLQTAKLDFKSLRRDLKEAVLNGLPERPSPNVLARQLLLFYVRVCVLSCVVVHRQAAGRPLQMDVGQRGRR